MIKLIAAIPIWLMFASIIHPSEDCMALCVAIIIAGALAGGDK